jgi:hypothetical protein
LNIATFPESPPEVNAGLCNKDGVAAPLDQHDATGALAMQDFSASVSARDEFAASPPAIAFDDFLRLDDLTLSRIFATADPQTTILALTGASPQLVERLRRRLPRNEADQLRRRMETFSPFRLRDVELAQEALARVASRLAAEKRIRFPQRRRAA